MTIAAQHVRNALNHLRRVDPAWRSILKQVGPFTVRLDQRPKWWLTHYLHCRCFRDFSQRRPAGVSYRSTVDWPETNVVDSVEASDWDADQHRFWAEVQAAEQHEGLVLQRPSTPQEWSNQSSQVAEILGRFQSTVLQRFRFYCWGELDSWPSSDLELQKVATQFCERTGGADPVPTLELAIDSWSPFRSVAAWYLERWAEMV